VTRDAFIQLVEERLDHFERLAAPEEPAARRAR
jgi:hypothetical protein